MRKLTQAVKAAASMVRDRSSARDGIVVGYDPSDFAVKVQIQPEGVTTGWIPLASEWVGNGWGLFLAPSLGDEVEVSFQEGNFEAARVTRRFFNDQERPLSVPSGEAWLVHAKGQFLKLLNSGEIVVSDGAGATVTLKGDGTMESAASNWKHTGPFNLIGDLDHQGNNTTTGSISASVSITAPNVVGTVNVTFGGKSGVDHTHSGVQPGSGTSGPPS